MSALPPNILLRMSHAPLYLETRAASKFWCWSSKTVFHLIAAEISGMRRSLGNKYGFRFWCWNAPFLPMIAPFLPVIAPSLPVQNFHCAVFVELRHVFYIAPFLWTCAWFFCRLGMRPKFWIHESLGIPAQQVMPGEDKGGPPWLNLVFPHVEVKLALWRPGYICVCVCVKRGWGSIGINKILKPSAIKNNIFSDIWCIYNILYINII